MGAEDIQVIPMSEFGPDTDDPAAADVGHWVTESLRAAVRRASNPIEEVSEQPKLYAVLDDGGNT